VSAAEAIDSILNAPGIHLNGVELALTTNTSTNQTILPELLPVKGGCAHGVTIPFPLQPLSATFVVL
jgi:hypothetical protein